MSDYRTVRQRLKEMEGRVVYVEGPHALLIPTEEIGGAGLRALYSPVVGKLIEVLEDGIVLRQDGGVDEVRPMANIRSVTVFDQAKASSGGGGKPGKVSPLLT